MNAKTMDAIAKEIDKKVYGGRTPYKTIVTLSLKEMQLVGQLMKKYAPYMKEMGYPTLDRVSTRKVMTTGTSAIIDYMVTDPGYLWIKVTHERPILMNRPIHNKDFEFVLDIREPDCKLARPIHDKEVIAFLDKEIDKEGHTNMQAILQDYIPCDFVKNYMRFATRERVLNNEYIEIKPVENFAEIAEKGLRISIREFNKKNMTEKWDTVNLTVNQFEKVIQTINDNHMEIEVDNTSLPRFCLSIFDKKQTGYYFFEKEGKILHCRIPDIETYMIDSFDIELLGKTETGLIQGRLIEPSTDYMKKWTHEKQDRDLENWEWLVNAFYIINTFMLNVGDVTMEVETKVAHEWEQKQSKKKHHHNVSRLFKSYKLIKNWKSQARKKAEITCPCWGVRGHYRHYKNGKVVFIEPFMKGKEKDAYKGKEYALLPYKDA